MEAVKREIPTASPKTKSYVEYMKTQMNKPIQKQMTLRMQISAVIEEEDADDEKANDRYNKTSAENIQRMMLMKQAELEDVNDYSDNKKVQNKHKKNLLVANKSR